MKTSDQQTRTSKASASQYSKEWRKKNKQHVTEYRRAYRRKQRAEREAQRAAPSLLIGTLQSICSQLDRIEFLMSDMAHGLESNRSTKASRKQPKRMFS